MDLDWRDIPKGYYAVPVMGYDLISSDDDPNTWEAPLLGHQTFRREVSRTCKNGRVIGKDRFYQGVAWLKAPAEAWKMPAGEMAQVSRNFQANNIWRDDRDFVVEAFIGPFGMAAEYQKTYGKISGRCGICHKHLTEPKSKLYGIGPECRGFR